MSVVGRDEPLAQLDAFVRGLPHAVPPLLVEGEPGIGKTTLWEHAVRAARTAQYRILVTRAAEGETPLAYAGLTDLLAGVDLPLDRLTPPQRAALEAALLLAEPVGEPDPRAVFTALTEIVRLLAADAPVLVAVDDRQWLDASSRRALDFVARRLEPLPAGILATQRPGGDRPAGWDVVQLGPLTAAAVHRLVTERAGVSLPRSTILRVHRTTNGNPFFALELVRALVDAGLPRAADEWPVPGDLRDLVAARVARLPLDVRAKLVRAAAQSSSTVAGLTPSELAAAEGAGIVVAGRLGAVGFVHPLFAAAIYAGVDAGERRRVHAELARETRDVESHARHAALAADGPDEETAARIAVAAARARARGAPEVAADLSERAAALTPDPVVARQRRLEAARHRFHAGDLAEARDDLERLVAAEDPGPTRSHARRLLAETTFRLGALDATLRQLRAAIDDAGDDLGAVVAAETDLAYVLNQSFTSFAESAAAAKRAVVAAETLGDDAVLAQALAINVATGLLAGGGVDEQLAARALELEDEHAAAPIERRPAFVVAWSLATADETLRARRLLVGLHGRLSEAGDEAQLPLVLALIAFVDGREGRLDAAAAGAAEAAERALALGSDAHAALARAFEALAAASAGVERRARVAAASAVDLAGRSGTRLAAFLASTALAQLELGLGRPEAVLTLVAESLRIAEAEQVVEPGRWPYLPDALEALVAVGDLERAERLIDALDASARRHDRTTAIAAAARARALLLAARGAPQAALAQLDSSPAIDRFPLDAGRTLLVRGRLERRLKQKRAARASLEAAFATFSRHGAALWAERARDELARVHGGGDGDLTVTERRVAQLAASGLTNREIATTAFMSQKTVEANLSRVYRKLGIRSRAELGLTLAAATPAGTPAGRAPRTAG